MYLTSSITRALNGGISVIKLCKNLIQEPPYFQQLSCGALACGVYAFLHLLQTSLMHTTTSILFHPSLNPFRTCLFTIIVISLKRKCGRPTLSFNETFVFEKSTSKSYSVIDTLNALRSPSYSTQVHHLSIRNIVLY